MLCPRCNIGQIVGGTGCFVRPFCRSLYSLDMNYLYTYKIKTYSGKDGIRK